MSTYLLYRGPSYPLSEETNQRGVPSRTFPSTRWSKRLEIIPYLEYRLATLNGVGHHDNPRREENTPIAQTRGVARTIVRFVERQSDFGDRPGLGHLRKNVVTDRRLALAHLVIEVTESIRSRKDFSGYGNLANVMHITAAADESGHQLVHSHVSSNRRGSEKGQYPLAPHVAKGTATHDLILKRSASSRPGSSSG